MYSAAGRAPTAGFTATSRWPRSCAKAGAEALRFDGWRRWPVGHRTSAACGSGRHRPRIGAGTGLRRRDSNGSSEPSSSSQRWCDVRSAGWSSGWMLNGFGSCRRMTRHRRALRGGWFGSRPRITRTDDRRRQDGASPFGHRQEWRFRCGSAQDSAMGGVAPSCRRWQPNFRGVTRGCAVPRVASPRGRRDHDGILP